MHNALSMQEKLAPQLICQHPIYPEKLLGTAQYFTDTKAYTTHMKHLPNGAGFFLIIHILPHQFINLENVP